MNKNLDGCLKYVTKNKLSRITKGYHDILLGNYEYDLDFADAIAIIATHIQIKYLKAIDCAIIILMLQRVAENGIERMLTFIKSEKK